MKFIKNIQELVGNTPLIRLNKISEETGNNVFGKCEFLNPTGSIKDRLASGILQDAFDKKLIDKSTTIIEPTSGNTGIALAAICAMYGMKVVLTMPSSMSVERLKMMKYLGATIHATEPKEGMKGAIEKAKELNETIKNSFILNQFDNKVNVQIHKNTTAQEILEDTDNKVDIFVSVSGTGGTISGVGEVLKEKNLETIIVLVEPEESRVIFGKEAHPHDIQGVGPNFIPSIFNKDIIDEFVGVTLKDAINASRTIAIEEGILVGISSGANLHTVRQISQKYKNQNKTIVTILCDSSSRYVSTKLYDIENY
jgi:cysteine synthase A